MGNIVVSGRMRNPASPWAAYKDKLEVRSVAFAGPGAIIQDVLELDEATKSFANDVASRSVNLIADQDIVSRFTTDLDFVDAYLDDVLPALAEERVPLPKLLFYVVDAKGKIDGLYEKGKDAAPVQALTKVAGTFRHACPLVMYEDDQSEPIFLTPWTDAGLLRSYKYQKLKRGEDPIQRALEQHSLTKDGLAYNND